MIDKPEKIIYSKKTAICHMIGQVRIGAKLYDLWNFACDQWQAFHKAEIKEVIDKCESYHNSIIKQKDVEICLLKMSLEAHLKYEAELLIKLSRLQNIVDGLPWVEEIKIIISDICKKERKTPKHRIRADIAKTIHKRIHGGKV